MTATTLTAARPAIVTTFLAILARDLRVMRRSFAATFMRVVLQPLLFVFVFSYVIPKIGPSALAAEPGGANFSTILVPGLIGTSLVMQGIMAVVFPLAMELSWQRSIDERALAPLPISLRWPWRRSSRPRRRRSSAGCWSSRRSCSCTPRARPRACTSAAGRC